jgi:hypothetical protein
VLNHEIPDLIQMELGCYFKFLFLAVLLFLFLFEPQHPGELGGLFHTLCAILAGIYVIFVQNVSVIRTNTQCKLYSN